MSGYVATLRTGIIVVVVTLLVWMLAESRTLRTETASITVQLQAAGSQSAEATLAVRPAEGSAWPASIELHLQGSAERVDELIDRLDQAVVLTPGRELPASPGLHEIDLRNALRLTDVFADSKVTIASTNPESVSIDVDRLVAIDMPVRAVALGAELDGPAHAEPDTVRVLVPASTTAGLDLASLQAVATVERSRISTLVPGRATKLPGVRVELPSELAEAWFTSVSPEQVEVSLTLLSRTVSYTIPRLAVQVMLAPTELDRWLITIDEADQVLTDVVVTGPTAAIDRIKNGDMPVAVVRLSFEELEGGVDAAPVMLIGLPPGVTARLDRPEVGLTVVAREAAADPAQTPEP